MLTLLVSCDVVVAVMDDMDDLGEQFPESELDGKSEVFLDSPLKLDKLIITDAFNEAFLLEGNRRSESLLSTALESSVMPSIFFLNKFGFNRFFIRLLSSSSSFESASGSLILTLMLSYFFSSPVLE